MAIDDRGCAWFPRAGRNVRGWREGPLWFQDPVAVLAAHDSDQVLTVVRRAEQAAGQGLWVVLMVAYEAAPAFDTALTVHDPGAFPLAWAALYRSPAGREPPRPPGGYSLSPWRAGVDQGAYEAAIAAIHAHLRQGETYQVNYTMPYTASFQGDSLGWFQAAARRQEAGYQAWLGMDGFDVLCFSPELFFSRQGDFLATRPMKGTMARGRFTAEDESQARRLAASAKDRAENVMIVDLVRNDLGRVAQAGSVQVRDLFQVETYGTLLQMTSTITARARPGVDLEALFQALFPCGSVTGAPKVATMRIIARLEQGPRRAYCGAVGLIPPGRDCEFCVPIRTVILDRRAGCGQAQAVFQVGGGVTHDSSARGEYEECGLKMRFLSRDEPDFRLLESLLLKDGEFFLLDEHLLRLKDSAQYFAFALDLDRVGKALAGIGKERPKGLHKVRLLMDRAGMVAVEAQELSQGWPAQVSVRMAKDRVDSSDPYLFHKTTRRSTYERMLAANPGADDVVLVNERGEVTETCSSNVVARVGGRLVTPPRECGLLAGTFRGHLLARGVIEERLLSVEEFLAAPRKWLINSVRRWRLVHRVLD